MNILTSRPLISIELLADRSRKPSALLFGPQADSAEALVPLSDAPDWRRLSGRIPCLLPDSLAPGLAEPLQRAGCRLVAQQAILRTEHQPEEDLPPVIGWIAGAWYLAPLARPSGSQAASRELALQLVQLVNEDADTHEIEAVLRRDPALSYHLLRLVNSPGMGLPKRITSFSQAILILGRAQLRRWLNLMLFSSRQSDERSAMLVARVAARARLMELLAKASGLDKSGQELAFMAGMFSLLGILFGLSLEEVLRPLKISDALQEALLTREGELGRLLTLVECAEHGRKDELATWLDSLQMPHAEFNLLAIQAHDWMLDVIHEPAGGAHA